MDTAGFANEAQILLTNAASLEDLNARLLAGKGGRGSRGPPQAVDVERFRPNLVVAGGPAFCEDGWDSLAIGECEFEVAGEGLLLHLVNGKAIRKTLTADIKYCVLCTSRPRMVNACPVWL